MTRKSCRSFMRKAAAVLVATSMLSIGVPGGAFATDGEESAPDSAFTVGGIQYEIDVMASQDFIASRGTWCVSVAGADDSALVDGSLVVPDKVQSPTDENVTYDVTSVSAFAFDGDERLKEVSFEGKLGGTIERAAFRNCVNLVSVTFPTQCVLGSTIVGTPGNEISTSAFEGCKSLKSIALPALVSAEAKAKSEFDGYWGYWHDGNGPVKDGKMGIRARAFFDCDELETVVFRAGNSGGAFAYTTGANCFSGCKNLKSFIFECRQPYFMNPDGGMYNRVIYDYWEGFEDDGRSIPDYYYAVDYYESEEAALEDVGAADGDYSRSRRLSRVEYKRGTSTVDIAVNAAEGYANPAQYAEKEGDGKPPALQDGYVWKLEGQYGAADELTESCYAYPVKANDLSAGHASSSELSSMRAEMPKHLDYLISTDRLAAYEGCSPDACWFEIMSDDVFSGISISAADGALLTEGEDYAVSWKVYDSKSDAFVDSSSFPEARAYLMVCTGMGKYEGSSLEQWVLARPHTAEVKSYYGGYAGKNSAAVISARATSSYERYGNTTAPYGVVAASEDPANMLIAAGYAGLSKGALAAASDDDMSFAAASMMNSSSESTVRRSLAIGLTKDQEDLLGKWASVLSTVRYEATGSIQSDSAFAAASYKAFERNRYKYGIGNSQWGDTAVVVPADLPVDYSAIAAYAYSAAAPVFIAAADGSISSETADILKTFKRAVVPGDEDVTPLATEQAIDDTAGVSVERIGAAADSATGFSLAVADALVEAGAATRASVAIVEGKSSDMVAAGLTQVGFENGIVLVANGSGDAKRIAAYLQLHRDEVDKVWLFASEEGVFDSQTWSAEKQIANIWSSEDEAVVEIRNGDAFSAGGAVYERQNATNVNKKSGYYCPAEVKKGLVVAYDGRSYTVRSVESDDILAGEWELSKRVGDVFQVGMTCSAEDAKLTYAVSNRAVATVDESGQVEVIGAGEALVYVRAIASDLSVAASGTIHLSATGPVGISGVAGTYSKVLGDAPFDLGAVASVEGATLTYVSNNSAVVAVDDKGIVTINGAGTAAITITAAAAGYETQTFVTAVSVEEKAQDTPEQKDEQSAEQEDVKTAGIDIGKTAVAGSGTSKAGYKALSSTTVAYCTTKAAGTTASVPSKVKVNGRTYKVTAVFTGAFKNKKKLKAVTVGPNVTTIGQKAFNNCPKLAKVTLGKSVTKIDKSAFFKTPKLATLVVKGAKLKKANVKASFSGSKVKKLIVKAPKTKKKAYKKVFAKANLKVSKKVTVK